MSNGHIMYCFMKGGTESCAAGIVAVGDVAAVGDAAGADAAVGTGVGSKSLHITNNYWDGLQGPSHNVEGNIVVLPAEEMQSFLSAKGRSSGILQRL